MWGNYLIVAMRALTKNRTYAFINIFGLALGLAACLLLLLYVRYETSYDTWLPDHQRVFQVQTINDDPETGERSIQQAAHGVVTETLPKDFPQIEAISRADGIAPVFMQNGVATLAEMIVVEEPFFDILQVPFLYGSRETALNGMDSLVVSRSEAVRLFGAEKAIGRTVTAIRRGEKYVLRVTGVFEDLPRNSHFELGLVGRISEQDKEACGWGCINGNVYAKLRPGADVSAINAGLQAWEKRNIPRQRVGETSVGEGDAFDWRFVNVADVHLSGAEGGVERPGNDPRTIVTFAVVAALILGIAIVNFVNLATAQASKRAREVALRKVLGAHRRQLVTQFLGESLLMTVIAMLIALALLELALPWFSAFLRADLDLHYLGQSGVLLPILGLVAAVGLVGGLYPAFYLSRYQPGEVLKANQSSAEPRGSGRLRQALVVAQFAVSIGLIICTTIVYAQTRFAQTSDPGFKRDGLIQIGEMTRAALIPLTATAMREIARVDGVEAVGGANITVASGRTLNTNVQVPGRADPLTIGWYSVSPSFFDTMKMRLRAGRTLSRAYANDYAWTPIEPEEAIEPAERQLAARGLNIVVNELAATQMGFADPQSAIGKQVRIDQYGEEIGTTPATIVGVVVDARFRSARDTVEPMIFFDRGIYSDLVVRYSSDDPEGVRRRIGEVWKRLAPEVPYTGEFADAQLAELYATDRARGQTFAGFAGLAIIIACMGLFGLAAFTAERRTKEIGIRKVFGATVRDIVQLLAWQFSKPVVLANLIAWPVAWWAMRDWLNNFDARIALTPTPFVLAGLLALAIAIGTIAGHALKVARANPIHALRYE